MNNLNKILLQINVVVNTGSTGRIAEEIGKIAIDNGWDSYIAYGRKSNKSKSKLIKIGSKYDFLYHILKTRLFDKHGFGSKNATLKFIKEIKKINPDIIHLHNIHGYYLNFKILFEFLNSCNIPIVWTLHDCWSFTGHCSYFDFINCNKWKFECGNCPQIQVYPKSYIVDCSNNNFNIKKKIFTTNCKNITLVPVSNWLADNVVQSFFHNNKIVIIKNGVDLNVFKCKLNQELIDKYNVNDKFIILGVANNWEDRKGFNYFVQLSKILDENEIIILIGLSIKQIKNLPKNIIGIERTDSLEELISLYSNSNVLFNPTLEDNYPTINLESIACGTPVITFNTGGSIEAIINEVGYIVDKGDLVHTRKCINDIKQKGKKYYQSICRETALNYFDKDTKFQEYLQLYSNLIQSKDV